MANVAKRVLGAVGAFALVGSLGALAACSVQEGEEKSGTSVQAVTDASVSIEIRDETGTVVGHGSGVLIAPHTVLTAAHLVAGRGSWVVTSAKGKKAVATHGQTFDWRAYDSTKAHPRKHDVAVLYLDTAIDLPVYPKVANTTRANGTEVQRVRGAGGNFRLETAQIGRVRQMPNAYVMSMPASETLDTGGAVMDKDGAIIGVVTGRGLQTGKLYAAKLAEVSAWLSEKAVCGGRADASLGIRTIGLPTPKDAGCEDGGSSSGGSSSGGTSSGGSSSGGSSSGGSGFPGTGSDFPKCDSGGGISFPGGTGLPGTESTPPGSGSGSGSETGALPGSSSGGSSGTSSGGSSGTSSGGSGESGSDGAIPGSSSGGSSGTSSGGSGESGSDGAIPGSSSGGSSGTSSGGSSSGSATPGSGSGSETGALPPPGSESGVDEEVCEGASDNPDICPPEPVDCEGSSCGGANAPADTTIDYGDCGCSGSAPVSQPEVIR